MNQPSDKQIADYLYDEFMETLKLLQSTADSRALKMWREDLHDLHEKAQHLLSGGNLAHKLQIICRTDLSTWQTMAKARNTSLNNMF